jgi:HEAT repeat protein
MLESDSPDAREDAAGAFGWMARNDPSMVDHLLDALEGESDLQIVDSLIVSLGQLRDRRAIGPLAQIVLSPDTDGDTRHTAIQSLATIARRRFDKAADPRGAATDWLASHGYGVPRDDEQG